MPTYYHLDRGHRLQEGAVIERSRNTSPKWFDDGLSLHGESYLRGTFQTKIINDKGKERFAVDQCTSLELLWELVRLNKFQGAPSRLQSFFAFESLDDARQFQALKQCGTIWEVETADPGFRADMSLLQTLPETGDVLQLADIYWAQFEGYDRSGMPTEWGPPVWEVLLSAPVRVVRAVG